MRKNPIAKQIISSVIKEYLNEMLDNDGGNFQPQGLNPEVVKLFENVDDLYHSSLDDDYWKEAYKKFPKSNSDDAHTDGAVNHIVNGMMKKYPDHNWGEIEKPMRDKIHGGLT